MLTGNHGLVVGLVQQSAPHEKADDALADCSLLVGIEQTAEAVDEDDGTNACVDLRCVVCFAQAFPKTLFDAVQEAVQHGVLQLGVVEMVA